MRPPGSPVAINVNPDVLLVDEVPRGRRRGASPTSGLDKVRRVQAQQQDESSSSPTSLNLIERFCDEALWLDTTATPCRMAIPNASSGAYLTKVEERAKKSCWRRPTAPGGRKARSRATPGPVGPGCRGGTGRSTRPRICFRRPKGVGARARLEITDGRVFSTARGGAVRFVFSFRPIRSPSRVKLPGGRQPVADFVFGFGLFNADGVLLLRQPTPTWRS